MSKKKLSTKKKASAAKKTSPGMGVRISKNTIKAAVATLSLARSTTGRRKPTARFVRVVMNPVVKPKHFSVSAIRNAVQQVVASR